MLEPALEHLRLVGLDRGQQVGRIEACGKRALPRLDDRRSQSCCGSRWELGAEGAGRDQTLPTPLQLSSAPQRIRPRSWSGPVRRHGSAEHTPSGELGDVVSGWDRGEGKEREMSGEQPELDLENMPAPGEGFLVTHFLTVRDVARARAFYVNVLGGQVVLEENPCIVKLANGWIILNPGGGPTPDKPGISVVSHEASNEVSSFLNLRVADIEACYRDWKAKGATFVTEPIDRGAEVRCYMRDPDGYLIEVGQAAGRREGKFAKKRPEDLPG